MGSRLQLQALLEEIAPHVYYQPPTVIQMEYPCIAYQRDQAFVQFGNNIPYRFTQRYQLTCIDQDPDVPISEKVKLLPMTVFLRHFSADNLNHDLYNIYF